MALIVNHNIPSLQAYNAVNATTNSLQKSIQKLSTGLRINSAADDAAGLAISEKMRAQIRGLDRAVANSQDGISMIQTAEGALNETHSILQRMRELSVQAANDTLTQQDRMYIQEEVNQLREEITRIGNTTQFNKKKLLDGSAAVLWTSSDINVKAIVNGGLREIDQFGQKKAAEGNYVFNVTPSGGTAQVLKTDVMRIKHYLKNSQGVQTTAGTKAYGGRVGDLATAGTKLYDIEVFWDKQGRFMIEDPQTIYINQGDGKQAKITLYQNDTIGTFTKKLNDAITNTVNAGGLEQGGTTHVVFNSAWDSGTAGVPKGNLQGVPGTIVIYSSVLGKAGNLNFSGDEDLMKALSLSTIQEAKEVEYVVTIKNAHKTSEIIASGVTITGNRLIGVVHKNIDVEFNPMIGMKTPTFTSAAGYTYTATGVGTFYLHLADNTTVFQIGANEGEDMGINIGDMRAHALGLNSVLVTDRDSATRSITIIDNAIDKVSMQRAKLGAYQNRLEHTINNLTVAGENLTAAESRIRDTDMAKEMMNFTKLQIMLQAGTGMLAQANQLPQNVLSLLR